MNSKKDILDGIMAKWIETIRPEEDVRPELDYGYTREGADFFINEIRPDWQQPEIIRHHSFAKIKYIKSRKLFKLYWMRASGKWELYEPAPQSETMYTLLKVVEDDALGCFFG